MKKIYAFIVLALAHMAARGEANTNAFFTPQQYNTIEPYLNKTMKQKLKPADAQEYGMTAQQAMVRTISGSGKTPIADYVRPASGEAKSARRAAVPSNQASGRRRVVARSAVKTAAGGSANRARAASAASSGRRRVVPRNRSASRLDGSNSQQHDSTTMAPAPKLPVAGDMSSTQCIANYSECMEGYCHRPDAKYDRCYCSPRLAQIDAEYRPAIDSLVQRITIMQNGGAIDDGLSERELEDFWDATFGASGDPNSMANLNSALGSIDWSTTESSVRGQNAFVAGDNFCRQYLAGCFYMAANMKDMYRTSIAKDCKTYETYLQKMKYGAEQIVSTYGD
ncbi:MAG: hypothetical protein LBB08_01160 [Rickettsiales bacterium]|jgi:hypothetical protein|nr:hypothetical protein [Rickettsiales bacterium]